MCSQVYLHLLHLVWWKCSTILCTYLFPYRSLGTLAIAGVFTPWKLGNITNQGLIYCFVIVWTLAKAEKMLIMQIKLPCLPNF